MYFKALTSAVALLGAAASVVAQDIAVVRDLAGRSSTLSKAELETLMPNKKVLRVLPNGNTIIWTNGTDGKFVASNDTKADGGFRVLTGQGTWKLDDEGRYCVSIDWRTSTAAWCWYIHRTTDSDFYGSTVLRPLAPVFKFSIG